MSEPSTDGNPAPTLYLFYGDDAFGMTEAVQGLTSKFEDPAAAQMNIEQFNAASFSWPSLIEVSTSAPFLADRRLIVVHNASNLVKRAEDRERALALFDNLPPTTRLVLLDPFELRNRSGLDKYRNRSALFKWISNHPDSSYSHAFVKPTGGAFVQWISTRVNSAGGEISNQAAQMLSEAVAGDLFLADQEIHKLLAFVDYSRPIEASEVELLTPLYRQSDVFALVDAVGARDARLALAHLHELIHADEPRYAFAMIARQFRLLLQAKEALLAGKDPKSALSVHPYVVGKISQQARNFQLPQLEDAIHQLYLLDLNSKVGRADVATELNQMIIQLAR